MRQQRLVVVFARAEVGVLVLGGELRKERWWVQVVLLRMIEKKLLGVVGRAALCAARRVPAGGGGDRLDSLLTRVHPNL